MIKTIMFIGVVAFVGFVGYSYTTTPKATNQVSVEEALRQFNDHRDAYNEHKEGPEKYLLYGSALADAWSGNKVSDVTVDSDWLNKQLIRMLNDLAFEPLTDTERQRYDRVREKLQSFFDQQTPTPISPTSVPPPVNPSCYECDRT